MINPRTTKPGPVRLAIPIVATAAIGTALYYRTRTSSDKTPRGEDLRNHRASEGLSGAGLGGANFPAGGAHKDVPHTDAPRHELPSSGAIGAGEGGGNTNVRAVDMFQGQPSGKNAYSASQNENQPQGLKEPSKNLSSGPGHHDSGTGLKVSQGLQGIFSQGGRASGERGETSGQKMFPDTKNSSQDVEAPSKRSPRKSEL